jgi:DNA-binding MarR family transcriptional regulator
MATKRERGERSNVLLNELDLTILKTLENSKKDIAILQLRGMLKISNKSNQRHISRLTQLGLIERQRVHKSARTILKITADGRRVLELFEKLLRNSKKSE